MRPNSAVSIFIDKSDVDSDAFVKCTSTVNGVPLTVGMIVIRGPDWKYGDVDGGKGNTGIVQGIDQIDQKKVKHFLVLGFCDVVLQI